MLQGKNMTRALTFSLLLSCLLFFCSCDKKSAYDNVQIPDIVTEERPFRMLKVNLLWEKAKKHLSGSKLADLYVDLKVQDKHEAAFKKLRADGMDKDGLKEAQVNAEFRDIIEKHGLEDFFKENELANEITPQQEKKMTHFSDKKLQAMWQRAEKAGFTEQDLEKLREEFWHQQMKIDELNFLKNELGIEDVTDNEISGSKKSGMTLEKRKDLNLDLKTKNKDIKSGYFRLEGMFSEFDKEEPDFKDNRVYQLWAMAQKTNWSEEERNSFKEELRHFENRLYKQEFFEDQLRKSADALKNDLEDGSYPEKHLQLEQKTRDLGIKVKKLHSDLKTRVDKAFAKHLEL
ncbi:alpha-2-macroglobulin receptor-associated protein-like isoform X2 [Pomacea canaliculata]|nr:alpha-2-macroglobulin receptor-associated protein-like isoform X2 [Pomacea canaliculata]